MQNFFRRAHGPGWALAGDAGYHKDPITAQGITDAFRDAEYLAEALDAGFTGSCPVDKALETYEARRNEAVMPMYEMICQLAAMDEPPPAVQELFGALRGNQYQTDRFFGLMAGSVAIPDFYSPGNIGRIMDENVSYALAA
jgi:2-polyprenyl-6-methoxyphenol hydroxylase-like FAD-dependent oxidoreductase